MRACVFDQMRFGGSMQQSLAHLGGTWQALDVRQKQRANPSCSTSFHAHFDGRSNQRQPKCSRDLIVFFRPFHVLTAHAFRLPCVCSDLDLHLHCLHVGVSLGCTKIPELVRLHATTNHQGIQHFISGPKYPTTRHQAPTISESEFAWLNPRPALQDHLKELQLRGMPWPELDALFIAAPLL